MNRFRTLFSALALASTVALPCPPAAAKGYLLAVGVARYQNPDNNLAGPALDVEDLTKLIRANFGTVIPEVRSLLDDRATRSNVVKELESLIGKAQSGDLVVLFFSGHGGQVTDRNGDEQDGKDEVLCCYDTGYGESLGLVLDDEIGQWLETLNRKGASFQIISDSCHSGTLTRGRGVQIGALTGAKVKYLELERTRGEEPADLRTATIPANSLVDVRGAVAEDDRSDGPTWMLLSGCSADTKSYEGPIDGNYRGMLTYEACAQIRKQAESGLRWGDVFPMVRDAVKNRSGGKQIPELTGDPTAVVFRPGGGGGTGNAVRLTCDTAQYKIGDVMRVSVELPFDGYLYLASTVGGQDFSILYPFKDEDKSRRWSKGAATLPPVGTRIRIVEPIGDCELFALVSQDRLDDLATNQNPWRQFYSAYCKRGLLRGAQAEAEDIASARVSIGTASYNTVPAQ